MASSGHGASRKEGIPDTLNVVVFECQRLRYAIDALAVRRILWLPQLTVVEEMPSYVAGVFNLQGRIVPVVDLNRRFGHPSHPCCLSDAVVVVETQDRQVGVIANQVFDVREAAGTHLAGADTSAHVLVGELDVQGQLVMLVDHHQLFPAADLARLAPQPAEREPFFPNATPEERTLLEQRARALLSEGVEDIVLLGGLAVIAWGEERFGVDLAVVREFSPVGDIVPVPCCPPHIAGNMNLRGEIVTIVDLRPTLNLVSGDLGGATKVIVAEHESRLVGIPVEDVLDVVYTSPALYRRMPAAVPLADENYLLGEVPYGERMLTVLDLHKILQNGDLIVDEEV
jgi:purine-binding chemotaxis protein CheW